MSPDEIVWIVFRVLHVGAATLVVGSLAFQKFAFGPGLAGKSDEEREAIESAVLKKWRMWIHLSVAILLVSGVVSLMNTMGMHKGQPIYHSLLGVKMLLALGAFAFAEIAFGKSERAKKMRKSGTSATIGLALVAIIVILGGVLRYVPISTGT